MNLESEIKQLTDLKWDERAYVFIGSIIIYAMIVAGVFSALYLAIQAYNLTILISHKEEFGILASLASFLVLVFYLPLKIYRVSMKYIKTFSLFSLLQKKTISLYTTYKDTHSSVQDINAILNTTEEIYSTLKFVRVMRRLSFLFTKNSKTKIQDLFKTVTDITYTILKDLKDDLHTNIRIQIKDLKNAQSQIKNSISVDNDLTHISHLQETRLDKQIEKFEWLRKVLIKV